MTDERAKLVEHLRRQAEFADDRCDEDAFLYAADQIEADGQRIAQLEAALRSYTEYCNICHGRGVIIEEDSVTGADLWRDCPGCSAATAALGELK